MKALITNHGILIRSANMLTGKSIGQGVKVAEIPKPKISPIEILVKVHAVALNPIDYKFIDFLAPSNQIAGCDFAGVVTEAGEVASTTWKVGDRVAGFVQGGIIQGYGSFAEYVKAEADLVWRIPEGVSDDKAATLGVSAVTAMQGLHLNLDVPWPDKIDNNGNKDPVFIYAGSSTVGLFAIQLAKRAGCTVVATASPHSFDLVKSYGADEVFDYRSSTAVQDITKAYPNIARALDCFSEGNSTHFCAQVVNNNHGKVITLLETKTSLTDVKVQMIMSFQMLGKPFAWLPPVGPKFPASTRDREALVRFYRGLTDLAPEIKAPPITLLDGGFESIIQGLNTLREGKVSGSKLVVKIGN